MWPAYYGDPPTSFGIGHLREGTGRSHSLIMCQPLLGEAICIHWASKQVAQWASREGYDVFRFDFSGTGNSLVDPASVTLPTWIRDIERAMDLIEERCGNSRVTLVGIRLGFALAANVSLRRDVENLIGWDPLLDGKTWLNDRKSDCEEQADGSFDYQGYPLNNTLLEQLENLQVRSIDSVQASAVTTSNHKWDYPPAQLGIDVFEASDIWNWSEPVDTLFYAHDSVRLICEQLA